MKVDLTGKLFDLRLFLGGELFHLGEDGFGCHSRCDG